MNSETPHPVWLPLEELLPHCEIRFKRASGPGGQNRNKVETGVAITHRATGIQGEATERRTQGENRSVAVARLRVLLAIEIRSDPSSDFERVLKSYRSKSGRLAISEGNWEWPIVLAEMMNMLAHRGWDLGLVAKELETTTSQLLKLLKQAPQAFRTVNQMRKSLGLTSFKA